jgi:RimJ/RimL family protein N-acetyltransferase
VGLPRIIAVTHREHMASRRVLEAIGLRYEKDVRLLGLDAAYYAIARDVA